MIYLQTLNLKMLGKNAKKPHIILFGSEYFFINILAYLQIICVCCVCVCVYIYLLSNDIECIPYYIQIIVKNLKCHYPKKSNGELELLRNFPVSRNQPFILNTCFPSVDLCLNNCKSCQKDVRNELKLKKQKTVMESLQIPE